MKRSLMNRIRGNRAFFVPVAALTLLSGMLLLPGCPGTVAGGGAIGISISVLAPTVNRDLSPGEKVTVVYNAGGSINTLEAIYDLDGTENTGDEAVVSGGLPSGDNQFFDLDTTGIAPGTYFIGVRGSNDAGSTITYATATVRVNGSPKAAFVNPDGTGAPVVSIVVGVGDTVQISFNMNDPENNVTWRVFYDLDQTPGNRTEVTIATGAGNAGNVAWDTRGVAPGTYFIGVTGTDNVGNEDTGYSPGTVTITRGAFVTVTAPAEDVLAFGGEDVEVRFSARGAGGGGTIQVFYDEDGKFDGDEVTIADNLPVTTTSVLWDTDTAPNGDFFVGVSVTDVLDNTVARYAPGVVQIRKEAGIEITKPSAETLVSRQKDDFLIEFFSTVPVGLGTIDIFFQAADADGNPTGDEMPVVDNDDDAATDLPANTRSVEWDLTKLVAAGEFVIGARLKMADGDLEDFSPVVTVSEIPTIELIEPTSNASPPVIVRDPLGNLTVVFRYTDPEDPKEVIIALDPDRPSANIDPGDDILDGDEIVFGPLTQADGLAPTENPEEFTLPDGIPLAEVPGGVYFIFLRIEDEAGGVDQGYGVSRRGEFIALEIRAGRLLGPFWVGQLELPVNGVKLDGAIFQGHNLQDHLGSAFLSAGDMTFDGRDDFLITARYGKPNNIQSNGIGRGEASLIFGREQYLNPQPFIGTNFTFDVNATGTALLPGSTLTGVAPTGGSATQTNGLGQVVAMKDADGDGRKELAVGFLNVNSASEANSKTCSLFHGLKFGNAPTLIRRDFSGCGKMVAAGQLLRGGIVMASSTNGLAQSGRVVNLGSAGIAGFSGTVEYVSEDRFWVPDDASIPFLPQGCFPSPNHLGVTLTVQRGAGFGGADPRRIKIDGQFIHDIILLQPNNLAAIKSFDDPDVHPNPPFTNIIEVGETQIDLLHLICDDPQRLIPGDTNIFIDSISVDDGNGGPFVEVPGLSRAILGAPCESAYSIAVQNIGGRVVLSNTVTVAPGCGRCKIKFAGDQCCVLNEQTSILFPGQGPEDDSECTESLVSAAFSGNDLAMLCGNENLAACLDILVGAALSTGQNGFGTGGTGGQMSDPVAYDLYFSPDSQLINFTNGAWCSKVGCAGLVIPSAFDPIPPRGTLLPTGFFSGTASVPGARVVGEDLDSRFSSSMDVFGSDLFATAPGGASGRGVAYIWEAGSADSLPILIIDAVAEEDRVNLTTSTPHGISGSACVDIDGVVGMTQLNGQSFNAVRTGPTTLRLLVSGEGFSDYDSGGTLFVNRSLWCESQQAKPFQYGLGQGTLERGAHVGPRVDPLVIVGSSERYANGSGTLPNLKPMTPVEQVVGIADFNNDLRTDVAVGAPQALEGDGAVYIYYRRSKSLEGDVDLTEMELPRTDVNRQTGMMVRPENGGPTNIHPRFGFSLARTGDLNGDGFQDMAVGAPGADQERGEVVILFGGANLNSPGVRREQGQGIVAADPDAQDGLPGFTVTQLMDLGLAARIVGVSPGDHTGFNVTSAGDIDGDGNPDLLIAAPDATPMFDSNGDGTPDSPGMDNNGDGTADMIVNRFGGKVSSSTLVGAGVVYLLYGSNNLTGTINLADIGQPHLQGAVFVGAVAGEQLGGGFDEVFPSDGSRFRARSYGISGAGDVNGDGNDDLLIGAMLADPQTRTNAGEAYLIFGTGSVE